MHEPITPATATLADSMTVLCYIGKHKGDGFRAWLGWAIIRAAQIGRKYRRGRHVVLLIGARAL